MGMATLYGTIAAVSSCLCIVEMKKDHHASILNYLGEAITEKETGSLVTYMVRHSKGILPRGECSATIYLLTNFTSINTAPVILEF